MPGSVSYGARHPTDSLLHGTFYFVNSMCRFAYSLFIDQKVVRTCMDPRCDDFKFLIFLRTVLQGIESGANLAWKNRHSG